MKTEKGNWRATGGEEDRGIAPVVEIDLWLEWVQKKSRENTQISVNIARVAGE